MSATQDVAASSLEPGFQVRLRRKRVNVVRIEAIARRVGSSGSVPVIRVWYRLLNGKALHYIDLRPTDLVPRYEHAVTA